MTITQRMENLFSNEDFQELILNKFIIEDIKHIALNENIDNENARDEIKARKILNDYLKYCLDYDKINKIRKDM